MTITVRTETVTSHHAASAASAAPAASPSPPSPASANAVPAAALASASAVPAGAIAVPAQAVQATADPVTAIAVRVASPDRPVVPNVYHGPLRIKFMVIAQMSLFDKICIVYDLDLSRGHADKMVFFYDRHRVCQCQGTGRFLGRW